jgi:H+/Cl- antiporter ClcA
MYENEEAQEGGDPTLPPIQQQLDHNEVLYKQLLDMVDLDNDDDDDLFSDTSSVATVGAPKIEITDPFVLDLFVVFGKPFALEGSFWTTGALVAGLQGGVMGFVCLAFFNAFDFTSRSWLGCWEDSVDGNTDYYDGMVNGESPAILGTGRWWWVGVTTGAGLLIGIIKRIPLVHFPKQPKGLFSEVKELHVEPKEGPGIALVSCVSLAAGASVGPEMAMGSLGGALGTFIAHQRNLGKDETFVSTLTGMAAAMGPLLPTPLLSVLLLHELSVMAGRPPKHFMETVCSTGIASTTSWFIFQFFADATILEPASLPFAMYDIVQQITPYKQEWLLEAALFGIIGGFLGLLTLVLLGLFRNIGNRFVMRLGQEKATLVLPVIGGFLIGLLGVAFPLTFGDGSLQLKFLISSKNELGRDYIIATLFAKMLTLGISLGFGFIGGQIFPCMFIGVCAGVVTTLVADVPIVVTVPCFMVAVPGAFCPCPFTFAGIAATVLVLGSEQSALVFTSVFFSFMTACGTGVLQRLVRRGGERQALLDIEVAKKKREKREKMEDRLLALKRENTLLRRLSSEVGLGANLSVADMQRILDSSKQSSSSPNATPPQRAGKVVHNPLTHKSPYL